MEDEDRPVRRGDAASLLAGENLDSYSQGELLARIEVLEAEIARTRAQHDRAGAHRLAAEAFFKSPSTTAGS